MKIEIKHRWSGKTIYKCDANSLKEATIEAVGERADLRGADLWGAYLQGADLRGADLGGADLGGAYLRGADLQEADLRDAKGYVNSHYFFAECCSRMEVEKITKSEWSFIGQVTIHLFCWDEIKERFKDVVPTLFDKLADQGFTEWRDYFKRITEE